jgi:hypothetical protein
MSATVTLREPQLTTFRQIIALDTRFADKRHVKAGVLYTAEAADLESADVVLVITRNGDDVNEYVKHAQPGQVRAARERDTLIRCVQALHRVGAKCCSATTQTYVMTKHKSRPSRSPLWITLVIAHAGVG